MSARSPRIGARTALAGALALLSGGTLQAAAPKEQDKAACCYTHQLFTGVCTVHPAKDETCGSIHAYLDDPSSVGKTYCESTEIRGGWARVPCKQTRRPTRATPSAPPGK